MAELVNTRLSPEPQSVRLARDTVRSVLQRHGLDRAAETATLLTSEVVTNAVRHARTPFGLWMDWNGRRVRVEVGDDSPELPRPREQPPTEPGGLGLAILAAGASRWGFQHERDDGKVVWFELDSD